MLSSLQGALGQCGKPIRLSLALRCRSKRQRLRLLGRLRHRLLPGVPQELLPRSRSTSRCPWVLLGRNRSWMPRCANVRQSQQRRAYRMVGRILCLHICVGVVGQIFCQFQRLPDLRLLWKTHFVVSGPAMQNCFCLHTLLRCISRITTCTIYSDCYSSRNFIVRIICRWLFPICLHNMFSFQILGLPLALARQSWFHSPHGTRHIVAIDSSAAMRQTNLQVQTRGCMTS